MSIQRAIGCDGCRAMVTATDETPAALRKALRKRGWRVSQRGGFDFCPDCAPKHAPLVRDFEGRRGWLARAITTRGGAHWERGTPLRVHTTHRGRLHVFVLNDRGDVVGEIRQIRIDDVKLASTEPPPEWERPGWECAGCGAPSPTGCACG